MKHFSVHTESINAQVVGGYAKIVLRVDFSLRQNVNIVTLKLWFTSGQVKSGQKSEKFDYWGSFCIVIL